MLQPEVLPTPKRVSVEPRLREQAIPEKDDDRFVDRFAFDIARALGERAIKVGVLSTFVEGIRALTTWRSQRHIVRAEQESAPDVQLVASTDARVAKATEESARYEDAAEKEERRVCSHEDVARGEAKKRDALPAAKRGSQTDGDLVLLADLVLFGVDLFAFHVALRRVPGNDAEHWLTAALMGGGAVGIGSVLGWLAAVAIIRADGGFRRPAWPFVVAITALGALTVGFLLNLGDFRSESLQKLAAHEGAQIADPTFFALAQILFSAGAAIVAFSYFCRENGRGLLRRQRTAEAERDKHRATAEALREEAERARQEAAEAPIRRDEAIARIHSRHQVADAMAELDRRQGDYLAKLPEAAEYYPRRADVEIGAHYWWLAVKSEVSSAFQAASSARPARAILVGLLVGAVALGLAGSLLVAGITGVVVAVALALTAPRPDAASATEQAARGDLSRTFRADIPVSSLDEDRASDIDRLVPLSDGNHHGHVDPDELRRTVNDA